MPFHPVLSACPACGGGWLEARYDYENIARALPKLVKQRPFNLWRYRELLPVGSSSSIDNPLSAVSANTGFSMGEGGTPLIHAENLGTMLGCPRLYIKDERQNPTSSFKDRQASVSVAALKEADICEVVLSSTGNVAIAYSAYAARAGIKLWAFVTSLVPAEKMRETALYGTEVIKVTASYDQAKKVAAEFAQQRGLFQERGARSIPSVEGMKTIAFEIAEQLAEITPFLPVNAYPWRAPDWYFQSVSGGLGPLGVQKGFNELLQMGLIEREPKIAAIQTEGCAPMVHAFRAGKEVAEPIRSPRTHIATLSTGDPGRTYTLLYQRMKQVARRNSSTTEAASGGVFEYVSDEETFRMMHILAKLEGISVEPASAVAFAGLVKLLREGVVNPEELIVVNCTGHTMPVEHMILGEGWGRDVALPPATADDIARREATPADVIARNEAIPADDIARTDATPADDIARTDATPADVIARNEATPADVIARYEAIPANKEHPLVSEQEGLLAALNQVTDDRFSHVLIVDDIEEPRRLLRRILQSQGSFTFSEAEDGWQAIELAQSGKPDLILLDLMMPGMDGFSVLDALKSDPNTASIPVIVITAKELTPEEKQRLGGRIHSMMKKGAFLSDDLLNEVKALLE